MVDAGSGCVPIDPQAPAQRTKVEVCARWVAGHTLTDPHPFSRATTADCDPGTLSAAGHADVLARLNLLRWLAGVRSTTLDTSMDAEMQKCANKNAWWDYATMVTRCDWPGVLSQINGPRLGGGAADAIEFWVENTWNRLTLIDRTMLLRSNLTDLRVGSWEGGTDGATHCFDYANTTPAPAPEPPWLAVPNPGPVPLEVASWANWTFRSNDTAGGSSQPLPTTISVTRLSDGARLPVVQTVLAPGFNHDLTSWTRDGWMPVAGESYRVTAAGLPHGDITYVVTPVACD
jgi:hypothetical protein